MGERGDWQRFSLDGEAFAKLLDDASRFNRPQYHGPVRQPPYGNNHSPWDESRTLPHDGLPRITSEGAEILVEGLHKDFARWEWSIGNHPFEIPAEHCYNCSICATREGDHFVAHAYTGKSYPQTKHNNGVVPWFCFDKVDLNESVTIRTHIALESTLDFWSHMIIFLDDKEAAGALVIEDECDDDECMEACEPTDALPTAYQTGRKQFSLEDFS